MIDYQVMKATLVGCLIFTFARSQTNDLDSSSESLQPNLPYSWIGSNALARLALVERQERLQFHCEEIMTREQLEERVLMPKDFKNILVNDKLGLLYCYVPKVACTNWKRVLMIASGKWLGDNPLEIPGDITHAAGTFQRLSNFTMLEIERKLASYDTLIVVRHPLERLLSAYRNKLESKNEKGSKYFQSRFGKKIVQNYRQNATQESLSKGDDVTFSEFVDFITDKNATGTSNEHWKPIHELCLPCKVNYNFISKYETLAEDAAEILERIGAGSIIFPMRSSTNEPTTAKLEHYYSTLSVKQLRKLAEMYRLDLRIFDYSLEEVLGFSVV
ncbi:carbohydrate sulfotransferase 11 [Chelonus insularis]|uniref:carbohydrate sulfotransferase 11 n=1 Tax=Chelonus insularis TaxID=460826 RepID=UPI0015885292|nr:carbohydrate sulfotransferase 11 [Chelonus insularis]